MIKVKDDGYTKIACDSCHQRFHRTERMVQVNGLFYHSFHAPKPVTETPPQKAKFYRTAVERLQ